MRVFILLIIAACIAAGCSKEQNKPYQVPDNIELLIAGDSLKTWKLAKRYNGKTRMNMGDCFLQYRQTFTTLREVYDNNSDNYNCGKSLEGDWSIVKDSNNTTFIRIKSGLIPELFNSDQEYKDFKIFYASKDSLHLSFYHKQYGQRRLISDYFVTEEIDVQGRDFHH